jgi:hypothetical protein
MIIVLEVAVLDDVGDDEAVEKVKLGFRSPAVPQIEC